MKTLYILRHAKATSSSGLGDKDRELSPKGIEDAIALGRIMKKKDYTPDLIFCSTATRTRQTCEYILGDTPNIKPHYDINLYGATKGELLTTIQGVGSHIERVMIIGHNPAIHGLVALLAQEQKPALMDRLMINYPTASLAVLKCPIEKWNDIQPTNNPLVDLLSPVDYNAPPRPTRWM